MSASNKRPSRLYVLSQSHIFAWFPWVGEANFGTTIGSGLIRAGVSAVASGLKSGLLVLGEGQSVKLARYDEIEFDSPSHGELIGQVAIDPDEQRFVSADLAGNVRIWSLARTSTAKHLQQLVSETLRNLPDEPISDLVSEHPDITKLFTEFKAVLPALTPSFCEAAFNSRECPAIQ